MRITALVENTAVNESFTPEFGLSLLIEANGKTVLFDSGQTGLNVDNAKKLGVDLSQVSAAVLSHGHYDHANGFPAFMRANSTAEIYVHEGYDAECFRGEEKYIGVTPELIGNDRVRVVKGRIDLGDGYVIDDFAGAPTPYPSNSSNLTVHVGDEFEPDSFDHEHYLIVTEGTTRVLVSGCSHRGIQNIVEWGKAYDINYLVGGFHLMNVDPANGKTLHEIAQRLMAHPVDYVTCHCTGLAQYALLKDEMGTRVSYLSTGASVELA